MNRAAQIDVMFKEKCNDETNSQRVHVVSYVYGH